MTSHEQPVDSVLETIGRTPLVALQDGPANVDLYAKLETFNPGASVKDRIGRYMDLWPLRDAASEARIVGERILFDDRDGVVAIS